MLVRVIFHEAPKTLKWPSGCAHLLVHIRRPPKTDNDQKMTTIKQSRRKEAEISRQEARTANYLKYVNEGSLLGMHVRKFTLQPSIMREFQCRLGRSFLRISGLNTQFQGILKGTDLRPLGGTDRAIFPEIDTSSLANQSACGAWIFPRDLRSLQIGIPPPNSAWDSLTCYRGHSGSLAESGKRSDPATPNSPTWSRKRVK